LRHITPDNISTEGLVNEMNRQLQLPGVSNAWTMPIKGRIEMLSSGMRTPVGLKIQGSDLNTIEEIGVQVEAALASVNGTRGVFAERTGGGYFLDFDWNREELARYGLTVDEAQQAIQNAIGGENVTTTVQGLERYPVNVRYMRDFRSDREALARVFVPASGGQRQIPLAELAKIHTANGPSMIRNENGLLTGYVYIDIAGRDPSSYMDQAQKAIREKVKLPSGYAILWSGQYEAMERVAERLRTVVPLTILLILLLLYVNTRSLVKTLMVVLAVPFSAVGAIWLLYLLGYNLSISVWVGLVALLGVDAETGVFMLLYLDLAYEKAWREGQLRNRAGLRRAIVEGAARRIRPKFMTVSTMFLGLIPVMWSTDAGADVMKRIAAPMIGGIFTSFLLELMIYPGIYELWKQHFPRNRELREAQEDISELPQTTKDNGQGRIAMRTYEQSRRLE
jgi:Cu(I)/Ag(I) efflux system membrane protein CusA/SilA